jgi:ABC-type branched-subunit amino acid transport system substrate-binding protein
MGGVHKKVKKVRRFFEPHLAAADHSFGKDHEKAFDAVHPIGTSMEEQYDATKAAEQAAKDAANQPVIPLPDEEEIRRNRRRSASARGGGRASTMLSGGDRDRLGA